MMKTLLIFALATLISGCVSQRLQHYRSNDYEEFKNHPERSVRHPDGTWFYPSNHWKFDRDIENRLNDRNLLLEQQ